ncbi:S1 motif domain-containing protein [Heracleum sosnowskyi]|uniref:S1 motif domain-containing protein n=1 Tax=Heracleum sosnowskyi TaxID=360622 RepID=A0AAD8LYH4_9APIA|nr:S1 motif domain-containing protein [Heracleum sosnowskyi]
MEAFSFKPTICSINSCEFGLLVSTPTRFSKLSFCWKSKKAGIFACKDEGEVGEEGEMGFEVGKMIGDDPKLNLSKIIGRNSNREISNLGIEKLLYKKNDKGLSYNRDVVSKKSVKFEVDDTANLSGIKKPSVPIQNAVDNTRGSVPPVILRKPSALLEDDNGTDNLLKFKIQPNLSLTMGKVKAKERFSDFTLITNAEPVTSTDHGIHDYFVNASAISTSNFEKNSRKIEPLCASKSNNVTLNVKSELLDIHHEQKSSEDRNVSTSVEDVSIVGDYSQFNGSLTGLQPLQQNGLGSSLKAYPCIEESEAKLINASSNMSKEAALHKPTRLDQSETTLNVLVHEKLVKKHTNFGSAELEDLPTSSPINELEDIDWTIAGNLVKTGQRDEVELISASTRGFVVSFRSLIGFLPYRNLAPKYKYFAFETWLRYRGLDPTMYKQSLSILGSSKDTGKAAALYSSLYIHFDQEVTSNMELEELLTIYDDEKFNFLTSLVDKRFKVYVVCADRESRKLILSMKPKEKEESIEKKRNLMGKLSIGEVVKCCITKMTYFGIFVEVEGVPAMIHQTEVSWDVNVNPTSCFKIGQIVEAKVHQLDFSLERIFLSLKEVVPDPLTKTLEAVDHVLQSRGSATAEADTEWTDIEKLVKELHQFEGINSVSRGRFFLSPDCTPTFQVYMASMFENQYKLLARAGNRVQEVIVETSLGKEDMKSAILTCTNRLQS